MEDNLPKKIEAVLFASGRFMDEAHIAELLAVSQKKVKKALEELEDRYTQTDGALKVIREENAWKIHVRDDYLEVVSKIISDTEVSGPVLETLAVIAWRSPILQSEIIHIRGTNAYEHIKELTDRGFVSKQSEGRSYRLKITEKFFEYFDIEGREDIRMMFKDIEEAHKKKEIDVEIKQKKLEQGIQEQGEEEVIEVDDEPEKQEKIEEEVDIEDLDKVLDKARETRERIATELAEARAKKLKKEHQEMDEALEESDDEKEDSNDEETEDSIDEKIVKTEKEDALEQIEKEDEEYGLDDAKKMREKVMKDLDDL